MIRTVSVGRAPDYDVLIGPRLMDRAGELLAPYAASGRVVVFADPTVAEHHGERLTAALEAAPLAAELVVGDGAPMRDLGPHDLLLLFGGGAMRTRLPAVAAALERGARLARAPTTLVAQVECVVVAYEPRPCVVLADLDVLATLPPEQVRAGYALVLKHALAADARLFSWLEAHGRSVSELEAPALAHAVSGCVEARARTPGDRLALGDAFTEALRTDNPSLAYGDAVGLGCALAFQLAAVLGVCAEDDQAERATWNLAAAGLPVRLEEAPVAPFSARALTARMRRACGGELALALPRRIGEAEVVGVDAAALEDFLVAEGALP
jgi:3-dehydroquinate synthase